jgi:hypothetical protein
MGYGKLHLRAAGEGVPMKFTIRDLFLVTACVALAVGWWLDRSKLAAQSESRYQRIYELTAEKHGRYPRPGELAPPWTELPYSVAPDPDSPKKQSGPDNDP